MKKLITGLLASFLFLITVCFCNAYVSVKGYYRSNGTYVQPYVRSEPNGLKYDNYGYKPSQGLYNDSYGTKGPAWDTPTWDTDPGYYTGKSIYDSNHTGTNTYNTYTPKIYSAPKYTVPKLNSLDDYDYNSLFKENDDEHSAFDSFKSYKPKSNSGLSIVNNIISSKNDYLKNPSGFRENLIQRLSDNNDYGNLGLDDTRFYVYTLLPDITSKPSAATSSFICNCGKTCPQMGSCAEAQYQLNSCGCKGRDADHDGIACDADCQ